MTIKNGDMPELKVGDKIATSSNMSRIPQIHTIGRITPTLYVCGFYKFKKGSLRVVGGGYKAGRVPTTEDYIRVRISDADHKISKVVVTSENLESVELFLAELDRTK